MKNAIEKLVKQRLHITPTAGYDFSGVLLHTDRNRDGYHTFANVEIYPPDSPAERLDGFLLFERAKVHFIQHIPPRTANGADI